MKFLKRFKPDKYRLVMLGNEKYVIQFKKYGTWYFPRYYPLTEAWCRIPLDKADYCKDGEDTMKEALDKLIKYMFDEDNKKLAEATIENSAVIIDSWKSFPEMREAIGNE